MKYFLLLVMVCNLSFAMIREDYLEVKGRVFVYDEKYVCLQADNGLGTMIPRDEITEEQLKSTDYIYVTIEIRKYFLMMDQLKKDEKNSIYWSCKRI